MRKKNKYIRMVNRPIITLNPLCEIKIDTDLPFLLVRVSHGTKTQLNTTHKVASAFEHLHPLNCLLMN
uniref:4-hydroxy-4-methyl-2-oxoglutarate aldolase n=1 Tax=Rhizophora mucronata TaxID=61149 RepID=A0A2P2IW93_RHIMU